MHCTVIQKSKYVVHSSSWSDVEHTTINRYLNQDAKGWWLNDWYPSSPIALTTWSGSSFQVLTTLSWQLFQLAEVSELRKKRLPGVDSERPYPDLREKIVFMFLVSSIQREISKFIVTVVQRKFQKRTKCDPYLKLFIWSKRSRFRHQDDIFYTRVIAITKTQKWERRLSLKLQQKQVLGGRHR